MRPDEILSRLPLGSRVLILRLRSLGDVVLLTPFLHALQRRRPDVRISVAVEPEYAPVLEGNPAVGDVLVARGFAETVAAIRRRRFALVYNQHGGPRSALYAALSKAPLRVGWERSQFSFLYNVRVPEAEAFYGTTRVHTVEHRMTQLYWTGLERGAIPAARVFPRPDALAAVARALAERGLDEGRPYAVLHPGATSFTKRWALEGFAQVARWLLDVHGLVPVIRLGPGDVAAAGDAQRLFSSVGIVLGPESLDLRGFVALVSRSRLFVGNDSGPAHVAAATGRPTVVIFGSSDSTTWRPWQTEHRVVQNGFACNPCRGDRCYAFAEPLCILSVPPEQVRDACSSLLLTIPRTA